MISLKKIFYKAFVFSVVALGPILGSAQNIVASDVNADSVDIRFSSERNPGNILLGGRYVVVPNGFGVELDFSYVWRNRVILQGTSGFHTSEVNDVTLNLMPFNLGVKYELLSANNSTFLYTGASANFYVQSVQNLTTSSDISNLLVGPAVFAEMEIVIFKKVSGMVRLEQVLVVGQNFTNIEGNNEELTFRNLSFGLRLGF